MKKTQTRLATGAAFITSAAAYAVVVALLASCASSETELPASAAPSSNETLYFKHEALPPLRVPAEVGGRTENPSDETGTVRTAFREAYLEALFRGLELRGVLGSDRVNPWPEGEPLSWSQNWRNTEVTPNSWGLPSLTLALGSYPVLAELPNLSNTEKVLGSVFTVHGPILDMYGRSSGYARSNGITGYGIPLGEVFFYEGMAVQRFSRGRMIVSGEGTRFSFEDDAFRSLLENLGSDEWIAEFGGDAIPEEISGAFAYAWAFTFSEKDGVSDGPVDMVTFSRPWIIEAGGEEIPVNGFYYKSYNDGRDILVLVDSPHLPRRAHLLTGPFLETILSRKRLSGLVVDRRLGSGGGPGIGGSLAAGFAIYGPPLSDPLPLPVTRGEVPAGGSTPGEDTPGEDTPGEAVSGGTALDAVNSGDEDTLAAETPPAEALPMYQQAQRFARGWMILGE